MTLTATEPSNVDSGFAMLVTCRQTVADLLTNLGYTIHLYLPDDVTTIPCGVVGRPTVEDSGTGDAAGFSVSVPVMVIGRPLRDVDAQSELDRVADLVADRFIAHFPITVTPEVENIAGVTYPAYLVTVTVPYRLC